jgi:hypothetical protein
MAGVCQPALPDQPGDGGGQGFGLQAERGQRLVTGEVGAAVDKLVINEFLK